MIDKLDTMRAYENNIIAVFEKINELVDEVNRLGREPVPHEHRDLRRGGPHPDFNWDDYSAEKKEYTKLWEDGE